MLPGRRAAQTDWRAWHEQYADERSPLSRRLRLVQRHIALSFTRTSGTRSSVEPPAEHPE
jgi:hypothetical protein